MNRLIEVSVVAIVIAMCCPAEAGRPRRSSGPSAAQIKYMQQEMIRYQTEVASKEREFYLSFDQNGNGHLEGGEKARYDKHMHAIQMGNEPNPLATIAPLGKGPKDWKGPSASSQSNK